GLCAVPPVPAGPTALGHLLLGAGRSAVVDRGRPRASGTRLGGRAAVHAEPGTRTLVRHAGRPVRPQTDPDARRDRARRHRDRVRPRRRDRPAHAAVGGSARHVVGNRQRPRYTGPAGPGTDARSGRAGGAGPPRVGAPVSAPPPRGRAGALAAARRTAPGARRLRLASGVRAAARVVTAGAPAVPVALAGLAGIGFSWSLFIASTIAALQT